MMDSTEWGTTAVAKTRFSFYFPPRVAGLIPTRYSPTDAGFAQYS